MPNYPQYFNPYVQQMQQAPVMPIQNTSSIVNVRSEEEARNYPIAPGVSMTFKNENAPYIYTKTMGLSQFDRPIFEKYRYEKEASVEPQNEPLSAQANENTLNELQAEIDDLRARLDALEKPKRTTKKEVVVDE